MSSSMITLLLNIAAPFDNNASSSCSSSSPSSSGSNSRPRYSCDDVAKEILLLLLGLFGIVGNIFALIVMRRTSKRLPSHSAAYPYSLNALAVMDTIVLVIDAANAIAQIIKISVGFDWLIQFFDFGSFGCALYRFFVPLCKLMSHWTVVAITTERFIAICLAFRVKMTPQKSKLIILGVAITAVLSQIWRLFYDRKTLYHYGTLDTGNGNNTTNASNESSSSPCINRTTASSYWGCGPPRDFLLTYVAVDQFYHKLVLLFLLPSILILAMNTAIVIKLYRTHLAMKRMGFGYHLGRLSATTPRHHSLMAPPTTPHHSHSCCFRSDSLSSAGVAASFCCPSAKISLNSRSSGTGTCCSARSSSERTSSVYRSIIQRRGVRFSSERTTSTTASASPLINDERTFLRTSLLLLAVTCSFLICLVPELVLLMYVLIKHLTEGHFAAVAIFLSLCQTIKTAEIFTTLGYADNFIIFAFASGKFRGELILMILKCFGHCSARCDAYYWRNKSEARCRNYLGAAGSASITPRNAGRVPKTSAALATQSMPHLRDDDDDPGFAMMSRDEYASTPPRQKRLKPIVEQDMKTIL